MNVADWLRGLGLERFEASFHDNGVTPDLLADLTADDLKDLGVTAVGDRRRLLKAIETLASGKPTSAGVDTASTIPSAPTRAQQDGERRHIAVMFCDLVGSTILAASMDPEDWRELNAAYHAAVATAVEEFGGYVAQKMGDGAMIYFGYPEARENDAERAVLAGLAIHRRLEELSARLTMAGKSPIAARVGAHVGPVVIDAGAYVFGDVPNVAARVQGAAAPGEVIITAALHRRVAGLVVAEDRGPHALKGIAEPLDLFRIVRVSGVRKRHHAGQPNTQLVGRDEELGLIRRRWERTVAGVSQFVLVTGEPGLGKSRLAEEFQAVAAETPHTWIEWTCSQLLQNTPFRPLIEWSYQRFGGVEVDPGRRLEELSASLRALKVDPTEAIPVLAPMFDLPLPEGLVRKPGNQAELRRRLFATLVGWFVASARMQPLIIVVEDLHWADPSTVELVRALADQATAAPLLLLATARPEFHMDWASRGHHTQINLAPLDRADSGRIVREIVARHGLTTEAVETVIERSGGVPLFLEEVTRLLMDSGQTGGEQLIPDTLAASLTARLDRLGPAREVAQVGAVLGREFSWPLLSTVTGIEEDGLRRSLEQLVDGDLLQVNGVPPDARYRFKHALIQEAAYESLLKSRRQKLHAGIAEILEADAILAARSPEILAYHCERGGNAARASIHWERAGDSAVARSSYTEAISAFRAAVADVERGPINADGRQRLLALLLKLGPALTIAKGMGSEVSFEAYNRAHALAAEVGDGKGLFKAKWGLWLQSSALRDYSSATMRAEELTALSRELDDDDLLFEALHCAWATAVFRGDNKRSRQLSGDGVARYRRERHAHSADQYAGHDPGVCAHGVHALSLTRAGFVEQAIRAGDAAVELGRSLDHPHSLAHGLVLASFAAQVAGDRTSTERFVAELSTVAERYDFPPQRMVVEFLTGWLRAGEDLAGGLALAELAFARRHMMRPFEPQIDTAMAEMLCRAGRFDDARAIVDLWLRGASGLNSENHNLASEFWRLRGELILAASPGALTEAESAFRKAATIAERQGAELLQLRALTSLGHLLRGSGRKAEAHGLLAPVYEAFTEGLASEHVRGARVLLDTIG